MKKNTGLKRAREINNKLIEQSFAAIAEAVDEFWIEAACVEEMARMLAEDQTLAGCLAHPATHIPG